MEYQTIVTIKESEKATVELAAVDMLVGPVIVKRLKGGNPEIYRLLSNQSNLHIPKMYAVEEQENELLIAEEYVDGESLGEHLQKNLLSDEQKLNYALQLCEAVGFLHAMNPSIIHRDIKPSNILINGKGELKLIDFDASRYYKEALSSSDTRLLGTIEYAPPEQFGYSQTDVRSDIYSMGVVFHEMHPTENKKLAEQWAKIAEKCTSFDPKNRYQSVEELKRELEKLTDWKKHRKAKFIAWIGSIALFLAVVAFAVVPGLRADAVENADEAKLATAPTDVPTIMPTLTPTEISTVALAATLTPEPTATSTPMPTATQLPALTNTPTVTPAPESLDEERQKRVAKIVAELKAQKKYIDTFYKELDTGADFMQYSTYYEGDEVTFLQIQVKNLFSGELFLIPEEFFYNENNVLHIKSDYLKEWEASCYRLNIVYKDMANGRKGESETHLQIFEGNEVSKDSMLFDNNFLDFYYEVDERIHLILSNDIVGKFKDTGEYHLLENGRVIEFNAEYLMNFIIPGESEIVVFNLQLEDGRTQPLKIQYLTGKPSYMK